MEKIEANFRSIKEVFNLLLENNVINRHKDIKTVPYNKNIKTIQKGKI